MAAVTPKRSLPTAPKELSPEARKLWKDVNTEFVLRADELNILRQLVREMTLIEQLERAWEADPAALMPGSHNGTVANPILSEIRGHRNTLLSLWKSLGLRDAAEEASDGPMSRSASGRKAAMARWGQANRSA